MVYKVKINTIPTWNSRENVAITARAGIRSLHGTNTSYHLEISEGSLGICKEWDLRTAAHQSGHAAFSSIHRCGSADSMGVRDREDLGPLIYCSSRPFSSPAQFQRPKQESPRSLYQQHVSHRLLLRKAFLIITPAFPTLPFLPKT